MKAWLLLLLLVPAAAAEPVLNVTSPVGRLEPDVDVGRVEIQVVLPCSDARLGGLGSGSTARGEFSFTTPPGIQVIGDPNITIPVGKCVTQPTGDVRAEALFGVEAGRDAPGLVAQEIQIMLRIQPSMPSEQALTATGTATVTVGYYPNLSLRVDEKVQEGSPGSRVSYTIQMTNTGNAPTVVQPTLVNPMSEGFTAELPEPVTLDPGKDTTVAVRVLLPDGAGWNNQQAELQVTWTSTAAMDPQSSGPVVTTQMLARVRGFGDGQSESAPAVGPLAMLALLAAVLLARRGFVPRTP